MDMLSARIEVTTYSEGNAELLGIQIDAAINSGNSGGLPLLECDKLSFQTHQFRPSIF